MNSNPKGNVVARVMSAIMGSFLVLFSLPCVIAMIHDLIVGTDNLTGALMGGGFFSVLAVIGFVFLYFAAKKPRERPLQIDEQTERTILHLARINGGTLSQAQIAMQSNLTLAQASKILAEYERMGVAFSTVGAGGGMEYTFADLITDRGQDEFLLDLKSTPGFDERVAHQDAEVSEQVHGQPRRDD